MNPLKPEEREELAKALQVPILRTAVQVVHNHYLPGEQMDEDIASLKEATDAEKAAFQYYRSSGVYLFWSDLARLTIQPKTESERREDPSRKGAWSDAVDPEDLKRLEAIKAKKRQQDAQDQSQQA